MGPLSGIASRSCLELLNGRKHRIRLPTLADLISLFTDQNEFCRDYMPPLSPAAIVIIAVFELVLRTQVIIAQCFGVGLELLWRDPFSGNAIKDVR